MKYLFKKQALSLIFSFLSTFCLAQGRDDFTGAPNTPLATYDSKYQDARNGGYSVDRLFLNGSGSVSTTTADNGGFSYVNNINDEGQMSQITRLIPIGSAPVTRMIVQTQPDMGRYYGFELAYGNNLIWYYGNNAIPWKSPVSIPQNLPTPLVMRITVNYPDATTAVVKAYVGPENGQLIELDELIVTADNTYGVPFLRGTTGGYPGMLYYQNGASAPLFKDFTDGVSFDTGLPVSLTSFTGENSNKAVKLKWSTASELNNSHFEVLRSADGKEFESIARVQGHGTSKQVQHYAFADGNPLSGTAYYQLKQVDLDGKFSKSEIIAVTHKEANSNLKVSCLADEVSLSVFSAQGGSATISILDIAGTKKLEKEVNLIKGYNTIPLYVQDRGVLLAVVKTGTENLIQKFIK